MPACKACGGSFTWRRIGEKWHAIDPNGQTNHWSHCVSRKRARAQLRAPEIRKGATITGEHYRPSCGRCDVPPWQRCACSTLLGGAEQFNAQAAVCGSPLAMEFSR